jgi:O-antigen/teichoic acid export membrane protein
MDVRDGVPEPGPGALTDTGGAAATTGRSVLAGGLLVTVSGIAPQLYLLVMSVAAARYLGPERMGQLSFISFASLAATMLCASGLGLSLTRYVGDLRGRGQTDRIRALAGRTFAWQQPFAAAGVGVLVAMAVVRPDLRLAWLLAAASCALRIQSTLALSVLMGLQRWREVTIIGLVTGGIGTPVVVLVLALGGGVTEVLAVEVGIAALHLLGAGVLTLRTLGRLAPTRATARGLVGPLLRYGALGTFQIALTIVVWQRAEFFVLERFSSYREIAFYSVAFSAVTALAALNQGVAAVVSPAVATLFGAGQEERIRAGFSRGMRLLLLLTLPLTAAALALGPRTLEVVYGARFVPAGNLLLIMVLALPLISLMGLASGLLTGTGRLRLSVLGLAVGAAVDVALALTLIPRYGATGAATANAGAQAVAALIVIGAAVHHARPLRVPLSHVVRVGIAAGIAGLAAWSVVHTVASPLALPLGLGIAGIAYAAVGAALRFVPREDADWLAAAVGDRLGGRPARLVLLAAGAPARPDGGVSR